MSQKLKDFVIVSILDNGSHAVTSSRARTALAALRGTPDIADGKATFTLALTEEQAVELALDLVLFVPRASHPVWNHITGDLASLRMHLERRLPDPHRKTYSRLEAEIARLRARKEKH